MQQDKMLKETKQGGTGGNYDEATSSLKSDLIHREEENEKLKVSGCHAKVPPVITSSPPPFFFLQKQLHETRLQARREQQLMMSAWYDIARHTRKEQVGAKVYPSSWLGQQRSKH
jgi:hypothetical protein